MYKKARCTRKVVNLLLSAVLVALPSSFLKLHIVLIEKFLKRDVTQSSLYFTSVLLIGYFLVGLSTRRKHSMRGRSLRGKRKRQGRVSKEEWNPASRAPRAP